MAAHLDHLIVPSRDRVAAARLLAYLLDAPWAEQGPVGPFSPVYVNAGLTLDFDQWSEPIPRQHYCFRVDQEEFNTVLARIKAAGIAYRSLPHGPDDYTVHPAFGGNLVYWSQPDGHVWELLTVSYERQPSSSGGGSEAGPSLEPTRTGARVSTETAGVEGNHAAPSSGPAMRPRISLITLAVEDLERSVAFYRDGLGLPTQGIMGTEFEIGAVAFFELQSGLKLALWPRTSLAADTGLPLRPSSAGSFSLAHNVGSEAEVEQVMARARRAGATIVKPAQRAFWGGYTGYFQDPDGHLWEVACNPDMPV